jgi:hypothetical protein
MTQASRKLYPYDGPQRLDEPKPYSFSGCGGVDFLGQFARSRARALAELGADERSALVDRHLPTARTYVPTDGMAGCGGELRLLWQKWTGDGAPESIVTAQLLEELIVAIADGPDGLLGMANEARWAREVVTRLLQRFEIYGCVHEEYDRNWRRLRSAPNAPDVIHRLALLGAWLAWLDAPLRRESSVAWLNATIKLLDLAVAGVLHGGWVIGSVGSARLAAAIRLEGRLVDGWRLRATGGSS